MLFHTWPFFAFFAVVYPVFLLIQRTRLRLPWLLVASCVFYAWLSPIYLIPLAYATVVDYLATGRMEKSSRPRVWLTLSIANNLSVLVFFKYAGFIAENINALLPYVHIPYTVPAPGWLLPAGLSFYLLQSISYVVDVYRGTIRRETSLLAPAAFASFLPRLLAGPIARADRKS